MVGSRIAVYAAACRHQNTINYTNRQVIACRQNGFSGAPAIGIGVIDLMGDVIESIGPAAADQMHFALYHRGGTGCARRRHPGAGAPAIQAGIIGPDFRIVGNGIRD